MDSLAWLQVNDVHLADQPPARRTSSYLMDVLDKLAAAVRIANEHGATVVITGDLFHRKNAAHTSHRTVQLVRDVLRDALEGVLIVPGNHDEANGGGLLGQPIMSVVDGRYIRILDGVEDVDRYLVGGIPWDNRFEREGGTALFAQRVRELGCRIVFAHAPIADRPWPFGRAVSEGWIDRFDLARYNLGRARVIAHGHMHPQQPIAHDQTSFVAQVTYSNPGALSRGTVAQHDLDRVPSVALIQYDGQRFDVSYIEVPHRPISEVFRLDEHARDEERSDMVDQLIAGLRAVDAEVVDHDTIHAWLNELPRPPEITEEQWRRGLARSHAALDEEG